MTSNRRADATGRSSSKLTPQAKRYLKLPKGSNWCWQTAELLNSPAWRAMSPNLRRVVDRIMLEHCRHAGLENGNLPVTHEDFEQHGCTRNAIAAAVSEGEALGILRVVRGGRFGEGKRPSLYRLTWLGTLTGPATNEWKAITDEMVRALKAHRRGQKKVRCGRRKKARAAVVPFPGPKTFSTP